MRKLSFSLIIWLFVLLFSSCNLINNKITFDQETFIEQKELWIKSNTKNYQYQLTASGFSTYDGTIFVENGDFKNDLWLHGNTCIDEWEDYSSIDAIYKTIERRFNSSNKKGTVYYTGIFIEYDKINHIPVKIEYEYKTAPLVMVDGTFHFEIGNFKKKID